VCSRKRLPMTKTIRDDYSDAELSLDDDEIFTITVTKRGEDATGQRQLLKLELDTGHDGFMDIIGSKFEGKKVLKRWQRWVPAKEGEERGHWEKVGAK